MGNQFPGAFTASIAAPENGTITSVTIIVSSVTVTVRTFQVAINGINVGPIMTIPILATSVTTATAIAFVQADWITLQCISQGTPAATGMCTMKTQ
jgi:hypothetical protein